MDEFFGLFVIQRKKEVIKKKRVRLYKYLGSDFFVLFGTFLQIVSGKQCENQKIAQQKEAAAVNLGGASCISIVYILHISEIEKIAVDLSENSKLVCLRYFPAIACQDTDTLHPFLIENEWHIIYNNKITHFHQACTKVE